VSKLIIDTVQDDEGKIAIVNGFLKATIQAGPVMALHLRLIFVRHDLCIVLGILKASSLSLNNTNKSELTFFVTVFPVSGSVHCLSVSVIK
jgi:hypothetical protein